MTLTVCAQNMIMTPFEKEKEREREKNIELHWTQSSSCMLQRTNQILQNASKTYNVIYVSLCNNMI